MGPRPGLDQFCKRKFQDTSITEFFKKQPKTSGADSPMVSNSTDGSNSDLNRVVKRWNDPQLKRRKESRAKADKERRARGTKSDSMKRTERVVEKIVQSKAERTGANLAVEAGRKSVVAEVMSMLQTRKKKPDMSVSSDCCITFLLKFSVWMSTHSFC